MVPARLLSPSLSAIQKRLESWSFDLPGSSSSFVEGLARENGWSKNHAAKVVAEYRRFLLLAVAAGHPVCPCDAVDQAWHRHLLETRSYWEEFCPHVLERPLHHTPSKGSVQEQQRLLEAYRQTLESYQIHFGTPPPADLWPAPEERFASGRRWMRVDVGRWWLIPRPGITITGFGHLGVVASLLAGVAMGLSGCGAMARPLSLLSVEGPQFVWVYLSLSSLAVLLALVLRRWLLRGPGRAQMEDIPTLTAAEMAYLAGGGSQVAKTALLSLLLKGVVQPVASGHPPRLQPWKPLGDPIAEAVALGLRRMPNGSAMAVLASVGRKAPLMAPLRHRLAEQGLLIEARRAWWARHGPMAPVVAVLGLGLWRMHQGLAAHRPVGCLLLASLGLMGVLGALWRRPPHRTARGDRLLGQLSRRYQSHPPTAEPDRLLPAFSLLGLKVVPVALAMGLAPLLAPMGWDGPRRKLAMVLSQRFLPGGCGGGSGGEGFAGWVGCGDGPDHGWSGQGWSDGMTDAGGGGGCGGGCGGCGGGG